MGHGKGFNLILKVMGITEGFKKENILQIYIFKSSSGPCENRPWE